MRQTAMNAVHELAQRDPRVVFIGSDLGAGTLVKMQKEFPDRYFMEGVSEAHIIGMAAGLAMDGFIPYVNTIATFLTRRCYEQVAIDLCLHELPVRLIGSGGGAVYAPLGPTHMATDDIAIMRALPNMTICAPADAEEMKRLMDASLDVRGPMYIRVAKGGDPIVSRSELGFSIGRAISMREGADVLFVSTGVLSGRCLSAAERLQSQGIEAGVLHAHTVKPLDVQQIRERAGRVSLVVSVEEHSLVGGLGSALAEMFADAGLATPLLRLGLPDTFTSSYGSQDSVLSKYGLTAEAIAASTQARLLSKVVG